ncbi:MAG: type II secretion system protein [Candidatus Vogelbacteria bacterium]|nr:type II secretion system protein [Candidatus Vogelbacteria bacterium]
MKLQAKSYPLKATWGFTMLEILIGASIIIASFLGVLTVFDRLTKSSRQMVELTQANFLLEEGIEAARTWRDSGWANLGNWPTETEYYLTWSGGKWATSTINFYLDGKFERRVKVLNVNRDNTSQDIILNGGTDDPNTKLVTVTVAWSASGEAATTTKIMSAYLTNLFN